VKPVGGLLAVMAFLAAAGPAIAGPWTQAKGKGQLIVKYEDMRADRGFDMDGLLADLPAARRDTVAGVFAEYGITDRLTVQFKGDWQSGEDAFVDYEGRGPVEIGVSWQVWRAERSAVSLYAGYADGGEGRNAGYAAPGIGDNDWEVRAAVGHSFGGSGRWGLTGSFVDLQAARRMRQGLPDETRVDATAGVHLNRDWLVLAQAYGGQADAGGPRWLSVETSVVRDFGDWSVQAGWRQAISGRETPESRGPVVALWRRF
jgi:protein XagA